MVQTFAIPEYSQESSSHVSTPGSPARGMGLHVQRSAPVRTSYARTSPGCCSLVNGWSAIALPRITTSRTTSGGDVPR